MTIYKCEINGVPGWLIEIDGTGTFHHTDLVTASQPFPSRADCIICAMAERLYAIASAAPIVVDSGSCKVVDQRLHPVAKNFPVL